jgi:hypothetical protein
MSLEILGVITEEKTERIDVSNKHIKSISNRLEKEKIPHLIIDDSTNGIGVILLDDVPSLLIHNDKKRQWEYLIREMEDEKEDIIVLQTCIIKDNNKDVDILDFLKVILKINKEEKEDKNDQ